jgi:hypothetical protein
MILHKIIAILATTLLFTLSVVAQETEFKTDVYNGDKVLVYNQNGNAVGFYYKTQINNNSVMVYDFSDNLVDCLKLDQKFNEPNIWLDEKTTVPKDPKKRLEPEEKVL